MKDLLRTDPILERSVVNAKAQEASKTQISSIPQDTTKVITFTKRIGEKWDISFSGPVSRRELNRLRVTMLMEWNRMKRRDRLKKRTNERQQRELMNAA